MSVALEQELGTFRRELPRLLADPTNRGKYALVRGEQVAGVFPTFDDGLAAGYDRFGFDPFMVKEIVEHEQPGFISRNVRCPS